MPIDSRSNRFDNVQQFAKFIIISGYNMWFEYLRAFIQFVKHVFYKYVTYILRRIIVKVV